MVRKLSLVLLVLVMVTPSVPAEYILVKLDLSQFGFANKEVKYTKAEKPPEWVYGFFEIVPGIPWQKKLAGADVIYLREHKWGKEAVFTPLDRTVQIKHIDNQTPLDQFKKKKNDAGKDPSELRLLARWALMHGLPKEFDETMGGLKKLMEKNPAGKDPTVVSYTNLKASFNTRVRDAKLRDYLDDIVKGGYKGRSLVEKIEEWDKEKKVKTTVEREGHFVLYIDERVPEFTDSSLRRRLNRMEQTMFNFFCWFALEENMPEEMKPRVPGFRLPVLLEPLETFDKKLKDWGPPRGNTSGFTIRSDNFVVLSSRPNAKLFRELERNLQPVLQGMRLTPDELITGVSNGQFIWNRADVKNKELQVSLVQTLTLMQKAFEDDVEASIISRECTRQLLGATGLLAPNVTAPEWVQSGLVNFFEIPPNSLYPSFGQLRGPLLKRFKSMKDRDKNLKDVDILLNLIDDRYFRDADNYFQQLEKLEKKENVTLSERERLKAKIKESLDTGEATSWAFVYYLSISGNMPKLFRYFELLNDLPRHTPPNAQTLEACFAVAFNLGEAAGPRTDPKKLDSGKLEKFANAWTYTMHLERAQELENVEAFITEDGK